MKLYFSGFQKPEGTKSLKLEINFLKHELQPFEYTAFDIYDATKSDLGETMIITECETLLFHLEVYISLSS